MLQVHCTFSFTKTKLRYVFKVAECLMEDLLPVHIRFFHVSQSFTRLTTDLFKQLFSSYHDYPAVIGIYFVHSEEPGLYFPTYHSVAV